MIISAKMYCLIVSIIIMLAILKLSVFEGGRELPPRFAKKLSQSSGGQTSPNNQRSHSPMDGGRGGRHTPPNNSG